MTSPNGPQVLTGSADHCVKVFDLATTSESANMVQKGNIGHIEVADNNNIMWSCDQPLYDEQQDITVGVVSLFNTTSGTSTPIHVSSC